MKYNSTTQTWEATDGPLYNTTASIYVQNGHTITSGGSFGNTVKIKILDGGTFTIVIPHSASVESMHVYGGGILNVYDALNIYTVSSTFTIDDNGIVNFYYNNGAISSLSGSMWNGIESFSTNSFFIVRDLPPLAAFRFVTDDTEISTTTSNGYSAMFGNLIIDMSGSANTASFDLFGTGITKNLTHKDFIFRTSAPSIPTYRITSTGTMNTGIGGDFITESTFDSPINTTTSGDVTLNIRGNLTHNDGSLLRVITSASTSSPKGVFNVDGNIVVTSGSTLSMNASGPSGTVISTINLKGDLTVDATSLLDDQNSTLTNVSFNFVCTCDGTTALKTQEVDIASTSANENRNIPFNINSGTYVQLKNRDLELGTNSNITVKTGGTFDFGFNGTTPLLAKISGVQTGPTFTSQTGSTLKITSTDGITTTDGVGNVQVLGVNRTFNQIATFWYIGKANQTTGNAITTASTAKTIISELNTISHTLTLSNAVTTSDKLILKSGIVTTSAANLFTLEAGGSIHTNILGTDGLPGSANSFVDGPFKKIGNTAFTFPLGETIWAPIGISAPSVATDAFTAEYFYSMHSDTTNHDATIHHISMIDYWDISSIVGSSIPTVTLFWKDNRYGITTISDLVVAHYETGNWKDMGQGSSSGSTTNGSITNSVTFPSFSPITFGSKTSKNPLPIELLTFNGKLESNSVKLSWTTASEINNSYFEIEKSIDDNLFTHLVTINGAGNSNSLKSYSTYDDKPNKINYYRLKQVDFDGNYTYSNIIAVETTNITNDKYDVIDVLGRIVYTNISNIKDIKPGVYFLYQKGIVKKIIVQ